MLSDADGEVQVDLHEGMPISNEKGEAVGTLASLLVAEDEDEAEFLIVRAEGKDRLVPITAVVGVDGDALVLAIDGSGVARFPEVGADEDPTDETVEEAYRTLDALSGAQ